MVKRWLRSLLLIFLITIMTSTSLVFAGRSDVVVPTGNFELNKYLGTPEIEPIRKSIWLELRSWGISPEATAAMMGNIEAESEYDPTRTQSNATWSEFRVGSVGIGLIQWTYFSRVDGLFNTARNLNLPWTDLKVQMTWLKEELEHWAYYDFDKFKNLINVDDATKIFFEKFESPYDSSLPRRLASAKKCLQDYRNLTPESVILNGTFQAGGQSPSTTATDGNATVSNQEKTSLTGMPEYSKISDNTKELPTSTSDTLSKEQQKSLAVILDNMNVDDNSGVFATIRILISVGGILLIMYGSLFIVCYLFDKANTMFDIGLVAVISIGRLKYTDDEEIAGTRGYINLRKLLMIVGISIGVGILILSGRLMSWIMLCLGFIMKRFGY